MSINWKEIFALQKQLDDRIIAEHHLENEERISWRTTAFLVELAEFANEGRWFKKWSNDQEPRRVKEVPIDQLRTRQTDPLLEEFVDAVHFIVGIGLEFGFTDVDEMILKIGNKEGSGHSGGFLAINSMSTEMFSAYHYGDLTIARMYWKNVFGSLIAFGRRFGITDEDIYRAYKEKHEINNLRQDRGY